MTDDVATVARVVKTLGQELDGVGPDLCARIGRALAAAFPELGLVTLGGGDSRGDRGDAPAVSPSSPVAPAVISSSDSDSPDQEESLSLPLQSGRARRGDEWHPPSPLSPPEWERETRDLLSVESEGEWRELRSEVRRQLLVGVELARTKGTPVAERLDLDKLELQAVRDALERIRKRTDAAPIGSPAAYLGVVVRGTAGDVLRFRARKASKRRENRARERAEQRAEQALAREAEDAVPLGRAGLERLKGLATVEPSSLEARRQGASG